MLAENGRPPLAARSWVACVVVLLAAAGCSNTNTQPPAAFPRAPSSRAAVNGSGTPVTGAATFDAPVVDVTTWQGTPMGTGSFSVSLTPALSGGPGSVAGADSQGSSTWYSVAIYDSSSPTGLVMGVISDTAWTAGAHAIDRVHLQVLVFDAQGQRVVAEATSGTVTLTAAGTAVGQRVTGSVSGSFVDVAPACTVDADCAAGEMCVSGSCVARPPPQCTSNAQCARGEICQSGLCVPAPGCTSNAQCAAGQVCQSGVCVPAPGCTSNAQCAAGQVCQAGVCVTPPPACRVDADCAAGQRCQAGVCVNGPPPQCVVDSDCAAGQFCVGGTCVSPPPQCRVDADCAAGQLCRSGVCVPGAPAGCGNMQGSGSYSGSFGALATCSAAGTGAVSVTNGQAMFDTSSGGLSLLIVDTSGGMDGLEIDLAACPSAIGTIALGGAVRATLYASVPGAAPDTDLYLARHAASGTVTFTQVSPAITGTVSLTFSGGAVTGTFSVR